jgi:PAS domain S-box-containing protein
MTNEALEYRIKELELELSTLKSVKDESTLPEQESAFYNIFLSIPTAIAISRLSNGNFVEVNSNFLKLTGYTRNEVIGRNSAELGINLDFNKRNEILSKLSLGEQVPDIEVEITSKSGERRIGLTSLKTIDFNGEQLICCSFIDITEQVKTGKALRESEELFRDIVSNTPDHIVIQDTDLKYTFVVNPQLGLTLTDMIGNTDFDLADKETAEEITVIKQSVLTTGEPRHIETSMMSKSGELEYFTGTYKPKFGHAGKINGLIGYFRNVTELVEAESEIRKSEEKFKLIFDKSNAPIMIADDKGNYLAVNKAASELFEYTVDELIHMNVGDIITTNNPDAAAQYEEYLIKGEETAEFDFVSKNGIYKTVKYQAVHTRPDFNLSIMMDISEQKRITEELQFAKLHADAATREAEEAKQHAENAMNAKQRFLSNMSHEIRTPMNSILGFTKILLKTDLNDIQKEYLQAIKTSSDVLIVLINDILDLAKVDAGKMVFENRVFKPEESISTVLHLFEPKILEKNLKLIKVYNKQIPRTLTGDPARLHQILLNLLSNAVKFTTKGSITVSVDLLHEDNEKVTIEFAVKDTGIGIPKDKIDTIFNNFEQASSLTSRVYGGTGLGLAIAKQLVEFQGGRISVKSNLGKGTSFSFILNFEKTSDAFEVEPDDTELIRGIKEISVLIVEDVKLNQLLLKTILLDFGFKYDVADNGKIAIEKLHSNVYDLILMDLMMPEMNGFEATEYIRNNMDSKIPIIALSADVTTVDIEKCKALGMNDYISKPIDEKLLFSKIVSLIK